MKLTTWYESFWLGVLVCAEGAVRVGSFGLWRPLWSLVFALNILARPEILAIIERDMDEHGNTEHYL